jgi:hypothetical protein
MHQYNVGALFERIAIDVEGPFPRSDKGSCYLLITMDHFTKWPEAYAIPDQETSTVADALVTNFFCRFGIPQLLHSDQGHKFEYHLLQEILQCVGVSKKHTTPPALAIRWHGGMVHNNCRTLVEGHPIQPEGLGHYATLFLLAYQASTHDTTGFTPTSLLFGRELPSDLLFRSPPGKERPTICVTFITVPATICGWPVTG